MEIIKQCKLNSTSCGTFVNFEKLVKLKELQDNVSDILNADIPITEHELICMRTSTYLDPEDVICPKHRFRLGKFYQPSVNCKYISHKINSKEKGMKVSWKVYNFVKSEDPSFILGSLICKTCQLKINKMITDTSDEDESDTDVYQPDLVIDKLDKSKKRAQLDSLTNLLGVKRVRFQINSNIEDMSNSSLNYFRGIHKQLQTNLTDTFCRLVAPEQDVQMKKELEESKPPDSFILHLKEAFNACNSRKARRAVLMLAPKELSKVKVSEIFDCSLYEVKKARHIMKMFGMCAEEPKKEKIYSRLSIEKAQHFINYLFSTNMLQELAYGTTNLKLDSGDKITIGSTILNGIHEHAIKQYKVHCNEIHYESLGRSTLLKMLMKMKPHTRTKLAGVDSFVVEGIEAFEVMRNCVKSLGKDDESKELMKRINLAESYLKARYKTHCHCDDSCISHCITHALSHPSDKDLQSKCNKIHDSICDECVNVVDSIETLKLKIVNLPTRRETEVMTHEIANAEIKISDWQKHIIRGVQQSKARSEAFKNLCSTWAIWIRDFAQKYLPSKVKCVCSY